MSERTTSDKNPNLAFLLELLGILGFLGIGNLYAGRIKGGILRLLLWWLFGSAYTFAMVASAFTGIGFFLGCIGVPIVIGVPLWSAIQLKRSMTE